MDALNPVCPHPGLLARLSQNMCAEPGAHCREEGELAALARFQGAGRLLVEAQEAHGDCPPRFPRRLAGSKPCTPGESLVNIKIGGKGCSTPKWDRHRLCPMAN